MPRRALVLTLAALTAAALAAPALAAPPERQGRGKDRASVELTEIGRYDAVATTEAGFDDGAAEIVAYDETTERLFVVNGSQVTLDVIDIADPADPTLVEQVYLSEFGAGLTGTSAGGGLVGVAVQPDDAQAAPGRAVFLDATSLDVLADVEVGFGPDALIFSPGGRYAAIANEGEPSSDYTLDPEGSVTIVDLRTFEATQVGFGELTADDLDDSTRIFGPDGPDGPDIAQDLEPENISWSRNQRTLWVTLQENNAIAEIDVRDGEVSEVFGLGFKDWSKAGKGFDASNEDGGINLENWPVLGIPQPDALGAYTARGRTYLVTANEGDARDYDAFSEESRVADLRVCEELASFQGDLGRLNVTTTLGFDAEDECYDELYAFGGRSFSIYGTDGDLVFDSGSDFEEITAAELGEDGFNATNDETGVASFDSRSDDKGPEPEGVAVGRAFGTTYAFIGLERVGGVMAYDVSNPRSPRFVDYATSRVLDAATPEESVDLGPEGVLFIRASDSPTRRPLVVLAHEISGTTTIYQLDRLPDRGHR